jgi:hypothetical protein
MKMLVFSECISLPQKASEIDGKLSGWFSDFDFVSVETPIQL